MAMLKPQGAVPRVVIVGGGLAGISAALRLAELGCQVTLLEARRRLGGRVGSYHDAATDQWVDYCQHVGMECCSQLQWLIDRLDQRASWEIQDTLHFYDAIGKYCPVRSLPLPAPFHLMGMIWSWPGLNWRERWSLGATLRKLVQWKQPSDQTMLEWLRSMRQSENTIGCFWEPILISALGDTLQRVTLSAARKVLVDGFAASRSAYHLWVPRLPMSELMNEQAHRKLEEVGVRVCLQAAMTRLELSGGIVQGVQAGDEFHEADQVLMAVPWYVANKMMQDMATEFGQPPKARLESSPITGVHTWWDRDWLPTKHAILIHRLCQWVFPAPPAIQADNGSYYQVVISGSRQLQGYTTPEVLQMVESDLKEVFPSCREARLIRGKVVTDRQAVFSMSPGHQEARWEHDRMADRHLWFCGDWTNTGWPATMEGAIRSGVQAADAIAGHRPRATSG